MYHFKHEFQYEVSLGFSFSELRNLGIIWSSKENSETGITSYDIDRFICLLPLDVSVKVVLLQNLLDISGV